MERSTRLEAIEGVGGDQTIRDAGSTITRLNNASGVIFSRPITTGAVYWPSSSNALDQARGEQRNCFFVQFKFVHKNSIPAIAGRWAP